MYHAASDQDWETVVLHSKHAKALLEARQIKETVRKPPAAATATAAGTPAWKIERDADELGKAPPKVSSDDRTAIVQGRTALKLTQAQLAQLARVGAGDVARVESGKATHDGALIGKLKKALERERAQREKAQQAKA